MKDKFSGINIKQKVMIKIEQTNRLFLESTFVWVNRPFVLVYTSQDAASKRFKSKSYYLPKGSYQKL